MVLGQDQYAVRIAHFQQRYPQQRARFQVERASRFGLDGGQQCRLISLPKLTRVDRQRPGRLDALAWLAVGIEEEARAQRLMPRRQVVECLAQGLEIQCPAQAQHGDHVVGSALRVQLPEHPLALLGMGEAQCLAVGQRHDGQAAQIDTFLQQALEQGHALVVVQPADPLDQFIALLGPLLKHQMPPIRPRRQKWRRNLVLPGTRYLSPGRPRRRGRRRGRRPESAIPRKTRS